MFFQQLIVLFTLNLLKQSSKAMIPDITLKGTKITSESIYIYQFICKTNVRFWGCNIELFVNNDINVKLRLSEKTCYNRYSICEPEICSCSDGCNEFKWNLTTHDHLDNTSIECEGRLQKYDLYFKANAHIMVNRNGFINLGSTVNPTKDDVKSVIVSSTSSSYLAKKTSDNQKIQIAILCCVSLIPIVLIIFILRWIYWRFSGSKGYSNNKWKVLCCPWNLSQSPATNKKAKTCVCGKKLGMDIYPDDSKHRTQQHNSKAKKPEVNRNPNDHNDRKHTIQQQSRTEKTSMISTIPDIKRHISCLKISNVEKTDINAYSNDTKQTIQQQSSKNMQNPSKWRTNENRIKDTCSTSSGSTDGNTSGDFLVRTNSIYV